MERATYFICVVSFKPISGVVVKLMEYVQCCHVDVTTGINESGTVLHNLWILLYTTPVYIHSVRLNGYGQQYAPHKTSASFNVLYRPFKIQLIVFEHIHSHIFMFFFHSFYIFWTFFPIYSTFFISIIEFTGPAFTRSGIQFIGQF